MNHTHRVSIRVADCSPHCTSLHSCHAGKIWCNAACMGDRPLRKRDTGWCMHGRTHGFCHTSAGRSGAQQMMLQTCLHTNPSNTLYLTLPCLAHASLNCSCQGMVHDAQQGKLAAMHFKCLAAQDKLTCQ